MEVLSHNPCRYYTTTKGYRLAYHFTEGDFPLIVFLGGFMSDMYGSKALFLEHYCRAAGRAYLRFDYMGHGQSEGIFTDGTISSWLTDTIIIIRHITDEPVYMAGSSMGGWIMLRYAQERPSSVKGLIGIAAAPDFTQEFMWKQFNKKQKNQLMTKGQLFLPSHYGNDYPITMALITDGAQQSFFNRPPVSSDIPVSLLQGMLDTDVPYRHAEKIAAHCGYPSVSIHMIKDGEHRLSRKQDLDLLALLFDSLLNR